MDRLRTLGRPLAFGIFLSATLSAATVSADEPRHPESATGAVEELPGVTAAPLPIGDAILRFRRENLSVLAARYDLVATRADAITAGLLPNPVIGVTGAFVVHGVPSGASRELYVTLTQSAPLAGQIALRREAAESVTTAQEREFAATLWQLVANVKVAYLDVQIAQARWRTIATGARDLDRVQRIIGERVAAGANAPYDRVRAGVEKSALHAKLADAETHLVASRVALSQAIGKDTSPVGLAATDALDEVPEQITDTAVLVEQALRQRFEVISARQRTTADALRVKSARRSASRAQHLNRPTSVW
jgi:outer membrane protein TolC